MKDSLFESVSFKDFMDKLRETKTYRSSADKEYQVTRVTSKEADLRDERTEKVFTVHTKVLHEAYLNLGADKCTVANMKSYVGAQAAPASAALIYWTLGRGTIRAIFHSTYEEMKPLLDGVHNTPFKDFVDSASHDELISNALVVGACSDPMEIERLSLEKLRTSYYEYTMKQAPTILYCLSYFDCKLLQLAINGNGDFHTHEFSVYHLMVDILGWVHRDNEDKEQGGITKISLSQEIKSAIAPHITEVIRKKEECHEDILEMAFNGLLNTYGSLPEADAAKMLHIVAGAQYPDLTIKFIQDWLNTCLWPIYALEDTVDGDGCSYYSLLAEPEDWAHSVSPQAESRSLPTLNELLCRGSYPKLQPWTQDEEKFVDFFTRKKDKEYALKLYNVVYMSVQDPKLDFSKLKKMLIGKMQELEPLKQGECDTLVRSMLNSIPRFTLKGNAPENEFSQLEWPSDHNTLNDYSRLPYMALPKVGRNDPCPCGSGKKYKKCCGRNL